MKPFSRLPFPVNHIFVDKGSSRDKVCIGRRCELKGNNGGDVEDEHHGGHYSSPGIAFLDTGQQQTIPKPDYPDPADNDGGGKVPDGRVVSVAVVASGRVGQTFQPNALANHNLGTE